MYTLVRINDRTQVKRTGLLKYPELPPMVMLFSSYKDAAKALNGMSAYEEYRVCKVSLEISE